MPQIQGLRSCYARVGGLVYFGRMLDKIRLHRAGVLPAGYHANLGRGFDARACAFLGVDYAALTARVLAGPATDEALLAWCLQSRGQPGDAAIEMWNRFMMKIGWRDNRTAALREQIVAYGLQDKPVDTFFDLIEFDEGRDPVATRAWELRPAVQILVMGVAGSGKTTVGRALADAMGWSFADADDFHPPANVARMAAGTPLTDEDRLPWLAAIRDHLLACQRRDESTVVTCSALRQAYRDRLLEGVPGVRLVHLKGAPALLRARLEARTDHFMKPDMLDSQLAALEEPPDALACDVADPPSVIVNRIRNALAL